MMQKTSLSARERLKTFSTLHCPTGKSRASGVTIRRHVSWIDDIFLNMTKEKRKAIKLLSKYLNIV